jgi:hypothetical protein
MDQLQQGIILPLLKGISRFLGPGFEFMDYLSVGLKPQGRGQTTALLLPALTFGQVSASF